MIPMKCKLHHFLLWVNAGNLQSHAGKIIYHLGNSEAVGHVLLLTLFDATINRSDARCQWQIPPSCFIITYLDAECAEKELAGRGSRHEEAPLSVPCPKGASMQ